jgi:integrase
MADHIRKTESGWVADFRVAGKRRQLRAKTKAEAQERMARELAELERQPVRASAFTLEEARKLSLEVRWKAMACETTAAGYSADVVAFFGEDTPLASITAQEVERLRAYLRAKGNSNATINWKVSCLQSMLRDAQLYGHLDVVPVLPKRLRMDNQKTRVLSEAEVEGFCAVLQAHGHPEAADLVVFLVETGCRWSEAESLRAKQVNLEQGRLLLPKTKNGKPRTVPLTSKAQAVLRERVSGGGERKVWSYSYKQFQHQWDRCKAALGLAGDLELTIHTCRHTLCSRLAQRGIPLPQIMAWSGHRSLQSVARYLHLDLTGLEAARAALEAGCS